MARLTQEVTDALNFYVYRLVDPRNGETFYVGKGSGNRINEHAENPSLKELDATVSDLKSDRIRKINNSNLNVIRIIHRHGMEEKTALEVEAALMDAYPGLTNIQGGVGSFDRGPENLDQLVEKYQAQEFELKHKAILVSVNKSQTDRDSIYEASRFAWKMSEDKARHYEVVIAHDKGKVVGVFQPKRWLPFTKNNFPLGFHLITNPVGRIGFEGEEAEKHIKDQYLRKRVPADFRPKGAANPFRYLDFTDKIDN